MRFDHYDYIICTCWYFCVIVYSVFFFFFKQKTAYEMRISDWSSDVCSSDLLFVEHLEQQHAAEHPGDRQPDEDARAPHHGRERRGIACVQPDRKSVV